jgi:ribosomal protein L37AE/L43A
MITMDVKTTNNIPECPLCKTDGIMEGKVINDNTFIWVCDTCPGILFEFHGNKNLKDLELYLNRDNYE